MKTTEMWIVMAYRYGDDRGYHFPVGVFISEEKAVRAATNHRTSRGMKYDHKIWQIPVDIEFDAEELKPVFNSCKISEAVVENDPITIQNPNNFIYTKDDKVFNRSFWKQQIETIFEKNK